MPTPAPTCGVTEARDRADQAQDEPRRLGDGQRGQDDLEGFWSRPCNIVADIEEGGILDRYPRWAEERDGGGRVGGTETGELLGITFNRANRRAGRGIQQSGLEPRKTDAGAGPAEIGDVKDPAVADVGCQRRFEAKWSGNGPIRDRYRSGAVPAERASPSSSFVSECTPPSCWWNHARPEARNVMTCGPSIPPSSHSLSACSTPGPIAGAHHRGWEQSRRSGREQASTDRNWPVRLSRGLLCNEPGMSIRASHNLLTQNQSIEANTTSMISGITADISRCGSTNHERERTPLRFTT